tara:strand:- start:33 stop:533 length:501 start_codon:yes stop_codon:yes gene_type:complete
MVWLNDRKIKYEDGKIWVWREMKSKPSNWVLLKGTILNTGYRHVGINKKQFLYHRVVYFIHNTDWKIHDTSMDNIIDHIDRNRLNNSIENLRVVTNSQNQWNRDVKGYDLHKASGKYQARIKLNGHQTYLGLFENEDDARTAYLNAKAIHHVIACSSVPPQFELLE